MKIVIAVDSLKGSLSSMEAGNIIKDTVGQVMDAEVYVSPLADGGEGTVEALVSGMKGKEIPVEVTGPLGEKTDAVYGIIEEKKMAVMEMASAAGLTLVPEEKRNPMETTTYGLGEMILDAAGKGCREFLIGIGGSATNDGGIGMLQALGVEFYNKEGESVGSYGKDMLEIHSFSDRNINPLIKECTFRIACDVENPLCGELGASAVYGPQKGADPEIVKEMDQGLKRLANLTEKHYGKKTAEIPGTGAAGGLGYAFVTFLNGSLQPGISLVLDIIQLEKKMEGADIVITGEGRMDAQTAMGKAPVGVARMAKEKGAKVLAFVGGATEDAAACNQAGIDAYFPIVQYPMELSQALRRETAESNLRLTVLQVFNLIKEMKS